VTADERRLLELLAENLNGATDALLKGYGFKLEMMVGLVDRGLVTASPERSFAANRPVDRTRVRITEAGRQALAGRQA
jgi:hypothetical protein